MLSDNQILDALTMSGLSNESLLTYEVGPYYITEITVGLRNFVEMIVKEVEKNKECEYSASLKT